MITTWLICDYFLITTTQVRGDIPPELASCSLLRELNLSKNKITGEIPAALGQCAKLQRLDLMRNQLKGDIPDDLGLCVDMVELGLGINQLTGEVPLAFRSFVKLKRLNLLSIPKLSVTKKVKRAIRVVAPTAKCDWPRLTEG